MGDSDIDINYTWTVDSHTGKEVGFGESAEITVADMPSTGTIYVTSKYLECEGKSQGKILVFEEVSPPNVFTPNGDGANDVLSLPFEAFENFNILILNRCGNVMWNQTDQTGIFLWDGTNNGQEKCTDGVYFYKLSGTMFGGTQQELHGFVRVIHSQ